MNNMNIQTLQICIFLHFTFLWAFEYHKNLEPLKTMLKSSHEPSTTSIAAHETANHWSDTDHYSSHYRDLFTNEFPDFGSESFNDFGFDIRKEPILDDSQSVISLFGLDDQNVLQTSNTQHEPGPLSFEGGNNSHHSQINPLKKGTSAQHPHVLQESSQPNLRSLGKMPEKNNHDLIIFPRPQALGADQQRTDQEAKMVKRKATLDGFNRGKKIKMDSNSEIENKTPLESVHETHKGSIDWRRLQMKISFVIMQERRCLLYKLSSISKDENRLRQHGLAASYLGKEIISRNESIFSNQFLLWYEINFTIKLIWKSHLKLDINLWESIISWKLEHGIFPIYIHKVSFLHKLFKDKRVQWPFQSEVEAFESAIGFFKDWVQKTFKIFLKD
ncbi:hypothetical protein DFH28DRAFT_1107198 [Melampsora americana]|nr:hypothetical protein DFH28DRAFT_1107198 [Melampsora americana]